MSKRQNHTAITAGQEPKYPVADALALTGRTFASLTLEETNIFSYFMVEGRKHGVVALARTSEDPSKLPTGESLAVLQEALRNTDAHISVQRIH